METGRIQVVLVANKNGNVIYERFYSRFSDLEKSEIRAALHQASEAFVGSSGLDEYEGVSRYRCGAVTFRLEYDLVFYAIGTGEYDELALAEVLRAITGALKDALKKTPSEAVLFDNYLRLCFVIDEIINEGIVESTDRELILKCLKAKGGD